jgi:S-adenosylmethionine hydrolase
MKGVILSSFRQAQIIDLCHGIPPQSLSEAAFWLEHSYTWFPPGTVHVAVVDPGVGSARRVLAVDSHGHTFLAPDNGLLATSLLDSADARVHDVDLERLAIKPPSATFHGRDVFAPIAAQLARGALTVSALGEPIAAQPCVLEAPALDGDSMAGTVITVDRFGNLITNLDRSLVELTRARHVVLGTRTIPLARTYADARPGELLALLNAFDVVELAVRDGNAEHHLGLGRGTPVSLPLAGRVIRA